MDSAIQRMNCRDISLRGRLRRKKGEGIGEGRKGIPPPFPLLLPTPLPLSPLSCAWHALLQGKWVPATYRWGKPGRTSIPSRGFFFGGGGGCDNTTKFVKLQNSS